MIEDRHCGPIDTFDLLAFLEGELAPTDAQRIEDHLAEPCPRCRSEVAFLRTVQETAMTPTETPPAPVREGAYTIPESTPQAQVDYDSEREGLAAGVHSVGCHERTIRWRVDALQIEVTLSPEGNTYNIAGQVLATDEAPVEGVQVLVDGDSRQRAVTDDIGCFTLTAAEPREFAFTPQGGAELRLLVPRD